MDDKMPVTPVVSIGSLVYEPRPADRLPSGAAAGKFHVERAMLTQRMGLGTLGVNATRVAPGMTGYPFHSHRVNDELFYVIAGRGELRLGDARHPVQAGDLIACPAGGPETAHQLINTGDVPLHYLSMSSERDPEICEYPDSQKIGVWAGDFGYMTRGNQPVDYWDGE